MFRSPVGGALHSLVGNHVVQGLVIFPGAGYLELARGAAVALERAGGLESVFFLQPLEIEAPGLQIECTVADGRFEVRSDGETVHCSGGFASASWMRVDQALVRGAQCVVPADVSILYAGFYAIGLQYGPGYRTLACTWDSGHSTAAARLQSRLTQQGTQVHPADLDDALCLIVVASSGGDGETRLPFAVDSSVLQGAAGLLWAGVEQQQGGEATDVRLGAVGHAAQAQLDGFKSRALRVSAPAQRHLYATEWRSVSVSPAEPGARVLVLSDEELVRAGCERLGSTTQRHELAAKLAAATWSVAAAAVACQRGQIERDALCALEVALALVQSQADATQPPAVWLLTTGTQQAARTHGASHAGAWGLARSARAEARLPVRCVDGGLAAACECGDALLEPELVVRSAHRLAPRLSAAPHFSDMTLAMSDTKLHVVTGGTGGLGLLTGRWLAQRGTGALFLA